MKNFSVVISGAWSVGSPLCPYGNPNFLFLPPIIFDPKPEREPSNPNPET